MAYEVPPDADEATRQQLGFLYGGVICHLGDSLLGLRPVGTDSFYEGRVGLDHVSFTVGSLADLGAAGATSRSNSLLQTQSKRRFDCVVRRSSDDRKASP